MKKSEQMNYAGTRFFRSQGELPQVATSIAKKLWESISWTNTVIVIALTLAHPAKAEVYDLPLPGNDVIGAITMVPARAQDTLLDIARRHGLGYEDIVRANPDVDTWLPGEGTEVILPTRFVLPPGPRRGIILNLAEYRLYYFPEPADGERGVVMTYPMSIGRMDWETPLGKTTIISKVTDPAWYPPESIRAEHAADGRSLPRIVPAGPDNPLGKHAMRLGLPGYLIHGTNRPSGVGMRVTHGCVRMYPEDIDYLFNQVAVNMPVRIINEPVKLGWDGDLLVMEAHRVLDVAAPLPEENPEIVRSQGELLQVAQDEPGEVEDIVSEAPRDRMTYLTEQFVAVTTTRGGQLDWDIAEGLLDAATGIPASVGRAIKNAATSAASE
jgi:L,D-transpeptidase ErfK/SrfK